MASMTKRRFTDEFKREAVALWETSGRMQTEVGIMPTMLRRWQRRLQESPVGVACRPQVRGSHGTTPRLISAPRTSTVSPAMSTISGAAYAGRCPGRTSTVLA